MGAGKGFDGEVAVYYAKHRRGYPPAVIDAIADAFGLTNGYSFGGEDDSRGDSGNGIRSGNGNRSGGKDSDRSASDDSADGNGNGNGDGDGDGECIGDADTGRGGNDVSGGVRGGTDTGDLVLDLGCGTGQLTMPLAARVRAVIGMDPEPDMLVLAREAASRRGVANVSWILGADRDVPSLGSLLGARRLGAMTVAVAIHWMDRDALFRVVRTLLRPGGGIAVVTNGTPLWLQDTEWSRALRTCLEAWTGRQHSAACQTDDSGRRLNRDALAAAGYRVVESSVDYEAELTIEDVVGGVFSAFSSDDLPRRQRREEFASSVREMLAPYEPLTENVRVSLQLGILPAV